MVRPVILANILVKKANKYLLVQEATDKIYGNINTHSKGKWTIPHGNVDEKEDVKTAAERELQEETGGKTTILRLGAIASGTLDGTIYLLSFIFYGEEFKETTENWKHEIKTVKWFTKEELRELEQNNEIRDNVPVLRIIDQIEKNDGVEFIEWEQPEHVKKVMEWLEKGNVVKRLQE